VGVHLAPPGVEKGSVRVVGQHTVQHCRADRDREAAQDGGRPVRLEHGGAGRAHAVLGRFSIPVSAVVVNRVLPDDAEGAFLAARRRQEARYLEEIDRAFAGIPQVRIPLLPDDVHDLDTLRALGRRIVAGETRPDPSTAP